MKPADFDHDFFILGYADGQIEVRMTQNLQVVQRFQLENRLPILKDIKYLSDKMYGYNYLACVVQDKEAYTLTIFP